MPTSIYAACLERVDERGDEEGRGQRGHRLEQLRLGLDPADLLDEPVRVRGRHLVLVKVKGVGVGLGVRVRGRHLVLMIEVG